MQMSARQAPCGFNSNSLMRGRSPRRTHSSVPSARTLSSATLRSPYSTVALDAFGTPAAKAAPPADTRKSRRFIPMSLALLLLFPELRFVGRRAVHPRDSNLIQPQVDAELRAMMNHVVHHHRP